MALSSPLDIRVPRNLTATLQLIQRLVGREQHRHYCSGRIRTDRVDRFLDKMAERYPAILRSTRERSYDRLRRGWASMHMLVSPEPYGHPVGPPMVCWLLLSDRGTGGLADPRSPDFSVSRDAMASSSHIEVGDYVLLYATKRRPVAVSDRQKHRKVTRFCEESTWTWQIRGQVMRSVRAGIEECSRNLDYGREGDEARGGRGLVGLLAAQRKRPLFAGVRRQVIDLHRYAAEEAWPPYRSAWLASHPALEQTHGSGAGALLSVRDLVRFHLPTMSQQSLYATPPPTIHHLLRARSAHRDSDEVVAISHEAPNPVRTT